MAWGKTARIWTPVDPLTCAQCAVKDEEIKRLRCELRRLVTELIDAAADLAVREGPER